MYKLLIVDDESINREVLKAGFEDLYEIFEAENGNQALEFLYYNESIDAVLLDLNMPQRNGFEVLQDLNETGLIQKIPVFIITSSDENDELLRAYELGATDVISKPYNIQFLRRRVENTIELYTQRNNLSTVVEEKTAELIRQNNRLVEAMADIVEFRSQESGTHVKRVSGYTKIIMEGLIYSFPEYKPLFEDLENISFAAALHDLGKIAIPDQILNKPGRLTTEEFAVMKTHSQHGYEQILALKDIMSQKLYTYSLDIAKSHHERWDGKGYPEGLCGNQIPIWAQVAGLADVYDALTTDRCYKKAFDHETAVKMIVGGDCGTFNPQLVEVFCELQQKCKELKLGITRRKILIVNDSSVERSILRSILINNFDVTEVECGVVAINHLRNNHNQYDAIIVDMVDSDKDEFEMVRKFGNDAIGNVPVIMSCAEMNKALFAKAAEYGIDGFIKKPYDQSNIIKKIRGIIGEVS